MEMIRCPSCKINLTPREASGKTCPICGDSLSALNSSPADPVEIRPPVADAPPTDLPRVNASPVSVRSRRRSMGSGLASKWWLLLIGLFLIRACNSLNRSYHSSSPTPIHYEDFDAEFDAETGEIDREEIERILQRARERNAEFEFEREPIDINE